MTVSEWEWR